MKKLFLTYIFIFSMVCSLYAAPSTTLSVLPSASDTTTIEASDENTRNNAITSWANAHDHDDIDAVSNTLSLGDGTAGNKNIEANNADATKPFLRYDDTNDRWVVSRDGSVVDTIVTVTGVTLKDFILPQAPSNNNHMLFNGIAWIGTKPYKSGSFTRDQSIASGTQVVSGIGFLPSAVIFFAAQSGVTGEMSIGVDDTVTPIVVLDNHNGTADQWSTTGSNSIYALEGSGVEIRGNISGTHGDGFIITWTRTGAPTGTLTILYTAFR